MRLSGGAGQRKVCQERNFNVIQFQNVCKSYKSGQPVLKDIDLTITTGELMVLIGESGCGKTTMLKTVNKLNAIDSGDVLLDGRSVKDVRLEEIPRIIGYVVQEGGLFPHLTVEENIALIMKNCGEKEDRIEARVTELLQLVNLDPEKYRNQYPSQLSGGQRQRVGVARAFAMDPNIILMDEPFSALDPITRNELQDEVVRLQKTWHKTILFVTHDMDEAVKIATRICFLHNGEIEQCDTPENILKYPKTDAVRTFIGKNRLWENPEFIKAKDIMRKKPFYISTHRTVMQALTIMRQNNIDSLMMEDGAGTFLGMLWLKDLADKGESIYSRNAEEFLSDRYVVVGEEENLKDILAKIRAFDFHGVGIIPVLDEQRIVVGYITRSSILSVLSRRFETEGEDGGFGADANSGTSSAGSADKAQTAEMDGKTADTADTGMKGGAAE